MLLSLASCHEQKVNPNENLRLDDYQSLRDEVFALSSRRVKSAIRQMVASDSDSTLSDFYSRSYYVKRRPLMWISRQGVTPMADTLVAHLHAVSSLGFSPEKFRLPEIERDLHTARTLSIRKGSSISILYGRLEYNLTKALFRFAAGQRFGYTNPNTLLNRLDFRDKDKQTYQHLYDLGSPSPKRSFYRVAARKVMTDSLSEFLDSVEPHSPFYKHLLSILNSDSVDYYGRELVMVNMERSRWRVKDYPWNHKKYVLVNIPSLHLRAVDGDNVLTMRIASGSLKTKTPQLSSEIERMDINPQWIMPRSIVKKSIIHRLGNRWYFKSRHYFIRDRATGKDIPSWQASPAALLDGSQLAIQEGGEGNALGRIIFRFNNDFSIFLHDTSSKGVFSQSARDVSHGCIRVEKPYQLAAFLLGDGNEKMKARIRYSMNADVSPLGKSEDELTDAQKAVADTLKRDMLVGRVAVKPKVPVFIWYLTLYPDANGMLRTYDDIYGFDDVIYRYLGNYQIIK